MIALTALSAADAPVMAEIHRQAFDAPESFDAPWSAAEFAALLAGPGVFAMGATLGGATPEGAAQPAGFVLCRVAADEAEILTLATLPDHRRRGVASALLAAANASAARAGAAVMFLEVAGDNPAAHALYLARGFREVGLRPHYYPRAGGAVQARIMRLDLNR
jgi:ribosomal-protein-alanine N-acetyltransferase